ncbi:M20/M25/M40 family metallo-hydrolase [Oceanispirochaeta crateris]|uniref:M20/M25/M40 family metallo-hydrolase n=2 Tax=Oceanispirochaeta crateris TaxID=2518645 RepID=A0A5C1QS24_9SPIO|nr:M20/M25/M40 family metallo-hydrolase [Oceanispirochaeta crateris]
MPGISTAPGGTFKYYLCLSSPAIYTEVAFKHNPRKMQMSVLIPLIVILFLILLFIRYLMLNKKDHQHQNTPPCPDSGEFAEKLSTLIQIPTVSWTDHEKTDIKQLIKFQEKLVDLFPLVHEKLEREVPDPYGIVYKWAGSDPLEEPVLFLAHYDVVPAQEQGDESWHHPPFSGIIENGELWGRGTLDIKSQLTFLLETVERLLHEGFQPKRSLYFAFGGDEEISGTNGAQKLAASFKDKGLKFAMIMDEGGVIAQHMLSFLGDKPAALIGLAEKGFVTFKISAHGESGHSSMPPSTGTVVSTLAQGISRICSRRQPSRLTPQIIGMLQGFVPWVPLPLGLVFANLWLFNPLIRLIFAGNKSTDSLIRTSQAFTVIKSGEQENIIPGEASCLVNHRILPGDTIESLKQRHMKKLKGLNLTIEDAGNWPSNDPIKPEKDENQGFYWVKEALKESHPEVVAVPFLVNGSTDSKYYRDLSGQIIRFTPLILNQEDINSIHGINEKVSLENLERALTFYRNLLFKL